MSKMQDSRKLTDDNKKRKRKPHVVAICSCNERKQALFSIHSEIHIEIWNILWDLLSFFHLNCLRVNMTKNTYYIYIHKYAPCHFVSSKKECAVAYTFLQDIFVPRLICTKFISCAQREIKNGGQVPVCFIVVCPELKATCYE